MKTTKKPYKHFLFFYYHYKDGTIKIKNAHKINLSIILGVEKSLLDLKKEKRVYKINSKDKISKNAKNLFKLKK